MMWSRRSLDRCAQSSRSAPRDDHVDWRWGAPCTSRPHRAHGCGACRLGVAGPRL